MRLDLKQLKHLTVETKSGTQLGHIHDIVLETEGQLIAQYIVISSLLRTKHYIISRSQIVGFTDSKLIVDDGVTPEEKGTRGSDKAVSTNPTPAA